MGIPGLLPLLADIHEPVHLAQFRGRAIAVDAFAWLHRAAHACAPDLALGRPTTKYLSFCRNRLLLLRQHGITPVVVFDGAPLPLKANTNADRSARRADARQRAHALVAAGKHADAEPLFKQCISVTPTMVQNLITLCEELDVPHLVAPYEADAQLAYLERSGYVDAVLTEDSDLLVFGARRVLVKLDSNGHATLLDRQRLTTDVRQPVSLVRWPTLRFLDWCILGGCDYLPSLPRVGLKTAAKLLQRATGIGAKEYSPSTVLRSILRIAATEYKPIPADYAARFDMARRTFLHQRVFSPRAQKLVHLRPWNDATEPAPDYLGADLDARTAVAIAVGAINPVSRVAHRTVKPLHRFFGERRCDGVWEVLPLPPAGVPRTVQRTRSMPLAFQPSTAAAPVKPAPNLVASGVPAAAKNRVLARPLSRSHSFQAAPAPPAAPRGSAVPGTAFGGYRDTVSSSSSSSSGGTSTASPSPQYAADDDDMYAVDVFQEFEDELAIQPARKVQEKKKASPYFAGMQKQQHEREELRTVLVPTVFARPVSPPARQEQQEEEPRAVLVPTVRVRPISPPPPSPPMRTVIVGTALAFSVAPSSPCLDVPPTSSPCRDVPPTRRAPVDLGPPSSPCFGVPSAAEWIDGDGSDDEGAWSGGMGDEDEDDDATPVPTTTRFEVHVESKSGTSSQWFPPYNRTASTTSAAPPPPPTPYRTAAPTPSRTPARPPAQGTITSFFARVSEPPPSASSTPGPARKPFQYASPTLTPAPAPAPVPRDDRAAPGFPAYSRDRRPTFGDAVPPPPAKRVALDSAWPSMTPDRIGLPLYPLSRRS
ncbi:Rad2 nuclease [Allomyces javanicus]|nr:Rad2 nuclease [Allomyces javanicus]